MCGNDPVNNHDILGYGPDDNSGSFPPPGPYPNPETSVWKLLLVTQGGIGYGDFNFTNYPDFPTSPPGQSFQRGSRPR